MRARATVISLLAVLLFFLIAACGGDEAEAPTTSPTGTTAASRTAPPPRTPPETPDPLDAVCAENPDPATDDTNQVDIPNAGDVVSSPITVEGRVASFEATFRITIFDAAGNAIADETAMSSEGQTLAPFQKDVAFSVSQETPACLWVYESSARDGSPVNVRQVPLVLLP
jgi:hypothetical protein